VSLESGDVGEPSLMSTSI